MRITFRYILYIILFSPGFLLQAATIDMSAFEALKSDGMIVYGPENAARHIYVFTDVDCGYCAKLHQEIPALNSAGLQVRYLAFPRSGLNSPAAKKLEAAFCANNPKLALTEAKLGIKLPDNDCSALVSQHYQMGKEAGITGTPYLVTDEGNTFSGAPASRKLLQHVGLKHAQVKPDYALLPAISRQEIPQQSFLSTKKIFEYKRPDERMPAVASYGPNQVRKFDLETRYKGEHWYGYRKGKDYLYAKADHFIAIPEVRNTPVEAKHAYVRVDTQLYAFPEDDAPTLSQVQKDVIMPINFQAEHQGKRWLGLKKSGMNLYIPADAVAELPELETTKIKAANYMANTNTAIFLAPDRAHIKQQDVPKQNYLRFTFEVVANGEKWLGFRQGQVNYYVPADDLSPKP